MQHRSTPTHLVQLRYTTASRFVLAGDHAELLRIVRLLLNLRGARILCFAIADNHVHIVVDATGAHVGRAVQAVTQTLTRSGGQVLSPTWSETVRGQHHLRNIVDYQIRQPTHHGVGVTDALWAGSTLHDLVGARRCGTFAPQRLYGHLPRLRASELLTDLGLPPLQLAPDELVRIGPAGIAAAAARAVARADLSGTGREVVAARRAATALMRSAQIPLAAFENAFSVTPGTLRRDDRSEPDPQMIEVVRRQLALHRAVERYALSALSRAQG